MRNPRLSLRRLPKSRRLGRVVRKILLQSLQQWPELVEPARAILQGRKPKDYPVDLLEKTRSAVLTALGATDSVRHRTRAAPANTPIQASVIEAWGHASDDPDSTTLASCLTMVPRWGSANPLALPGFSRQPRPKVWFRIVKWIVGPWKDGATTPRPSRRRKCLTNSSRTMSPGASAIE